MKKKISKNVINFKTDNEALTHVYIDVKNPGSFSSIKKLYENTKKLRPSLTLKKTKEFLLSQNAYTLHTQVKRKFNRRRFMSSRPGIILYADVAYNQD